MIAKVFNALPVSSFRAISIDPSDVA